MTRAEYRRAERQARNDRAFLDSFPKPRPAEPGRVNIWACPKCHLPTVAIDIHAGTTSFILVCRARLADFDAMGDPVVDQDQLCGGAARSTMYLLPNPDETPDWVARLLADPPWEWYLPTDLAELRSLEPELAEHVRKGGLLLRRRPGHGFDPAEELAKPENAVERTRWQRFWEGLASR